MAANPLTRLPDPRGTPLEVGAGNAWTYGLALDPTGTYLAQSYTSLQLLVGNSYVKTAFYTRTGDTWTRGTMDPPATDQGPVINLAWTPDGKYCAATTGNDVFSPVDNRWIWMYARNGTSLDLVGHAPPQANVLGAGYASNATIEFSPDGRWLAATDNQGAGWCGLLRHDGNGHLSLGPQFKDAGDLSIEGGFAVSWHPTLNGLIALCDSYYRVMVFQIGDDDTLTHLMTMNGYQNVTVRWHPSGTLLLGAAPVFCSTLFPVVFRWPGLSALGILPDYAFCYNGLAFSPDGKYLAGGFVSESGNAWGPWQGLTLAGVDATVGDPDGGYGEPWTGYRVFDRPTGGDQIAGNLNAWGTDNGTAYLASSAFPGYPGYIDPSLDLYGSPWGFHTYRLGAGGPTSTLFEQTRDGTFVNVGTAEQPLSIALPDGSYRTWPGAAEPLRIQLADGTWRQVI